MKLPRRFEPLRGRVTQSNRADKEYDTLAAQLSCNQSDRDSFFATGHTALLAASVAFVGTAVPLSEAKVPILLIFSWVAGAIGLLGLAISFFAADVEINHRIEHVHASSLPKIRNRLSPWRWPSKFLHAIVAITFPISILLLLSFLVLNVWNDNGKRQASAPIAAKERPKESTAGQCPHSRTVACTAPAEERLMARQPLNEGQRPVPRQPSPPLAKPKPDTK